MITFITLLSTLFIVILFRNILKMRPIPFYVLATFVAIFAIYYPTRPLFIPIINGSIGLDLFILVMFIGVIPKTKAFFQEVHLIRGPLSIIGFLLITPHAVTNLLVNVDTWSNDFGTIVGILAYLLMIPLFLTSFDFIRKWMSHSDWTSLHKWSYVIYLTLFLHLFFLSSNTHQLFYSVIFGTYTLTRFYKAYKVKRVLKIAFSIVVILCGILINQRFFLHSKEINFSTETYQDGTYQGMGLGFRSLPVIVNVTIQNNTITKITILNTGFTGGNYVSILNQAALQIVTEQKLSTDANTGATYSVNGLDNAVRAALNKAKIN